MTTPAIHMGHELMLLLRDDDTGDRLVNDRSGRVHLAYCAALVCEWSFLGHLKTTGANQFRLAPFEPRTESERLAVACIPDKALPIGKLIRAIVGWSPRNRMAPALGELVDYGMLSQEIDSFLFITLKKRYPEVDGSYERILRQALLAHIAEPGDVPHRYDGLLGLLRVTDALELVFPPEQHALDRDQVVRLTERVPIGRTVRDLIKENEAAAVAASI